MKKQRPSPLSAAGGLRGEAKAIAGFEGFSIVVSKELVERIRKSNTEAAELLEAMYSAMGGRHEAADGWPISPSEVAYHLRNATYEFNGEGQGADNEPAITPVYCGVLRQAAAMLEYLDKIVTPFVAMEATKE